MKTGSRLFEALPSTLRSAFSSGENYKVTAADTAGRNRLVINLLLVATFVVILNETLMAVAIPRLMHDLNVTAGAVQWLTTAFLLTMSVIIPVTGFLLQRINTRPIFILAMSLFTLGTSIAALASNLEVLILA